MHAPRQSAASMKPASGEYAPMASMKRSETSRLESGSLFRVCARFSASSRSSAGSSRGRKAALPCGAISADMGRRRLVYPARMDAPRPAAHVDTLRHGRACPGHPRVFRAAVAKNVDARTKSGHDGKEKQRGRKRRIPTETNFWERTLIDEVVDGGLLHGPFAGVPIVAREGEAVPLGVVQCRMIGPIVVSRPARFRPEHRVMGHGLRGQDPVVKLPRPLKLVQVFGPEKVRGLPSACPAAPARG